MPAQGRDLLGHLQQHFARGEIHQPLEEVEPHPAHAGGVQRLQLGVGDIGLHRGHALGLAAGGLQCIDQRAVIGAMTSGLDDDVALEAQEIAQGEQLFLGRVAGGVFALGRIGEDRGRAEHVAVRVHRPRRRPVGGLGGIGVERQVVGVHGRLSQWPCLLGGTPG